MPHEDKLAQRIATQVDLANLDLLMITGVGAAYPMVRSHTLLTALQATMKNTPPGWSIPIAISGSTSLAAGPTITVRAASAADKAQRNGRLKRVKG